MQENPQDAQEPKTVIFQSPEDQLWYFWDESYSYTYGPFVSEREAKREFGIYCREQLF